MIIIAVAWIFGRLSKKIGQPLVVGEIAAGVVLGPSVLGMIWPSHWPALFPAESQPALDLLGKLGVILLLFQVGMEFDFAHLRTRSQTVVAVSLMGILAPVIGSICVGNWLHANFAPQTNLFGFQCFLCIALSITALPVLGRILMEMKLERTAVGALAISAAAIDDIVGWIGLAVVTALATSNFNWVGLLVQSVGVICFFSDVTAKVDRPGGEMVLAAKHCHERPVRFIENAAGIFSGIAYLFAWFVLCLTSQLGIFFAVRRVSVWRRVA